MTEFKVGDKVEVVRLGGLTSYRYFEDGEYVKVVQVDNPVTDNYPVYICNKKGNCSWASLDAIELVIDEPVEYSEDNCDEDTEGVTEATPIDLPTVKFIYEQWKTILGIEGQTDEVAANVFSGYISGLMQGLKGDLDG